MSQSVIVPSLQADSVLDRTQCQCLRLPQHIHCNSFYLLQSPLDKLTHIAPSDHLELEADVSLLLRGLCQCVVCRDLDFTSCRVSVGASVGDIVREDSEVLHVFVVHHV